MQTLSMLQRDISRMTMLISYTKIYEMMVWWIRGWNATFSLLPIVPRHKCNQIPLWYILERSFWNRCPPLAYISGTFIISPRWIVQYSIKHFSALILIDFQTNANCITYQRRPHIRSKGFLINLDSLYYFDNHLPLA